MNISIFTLPLFILSIISAYMAYKSQVYLYYGRAIASEDELKSSPNGFQNTLTDPSTNILFFIVNGFLVLYLAVAFYFLSFIGVLIVVANYFAILVILVVLLPKPSSPKWAKGIHKSLKCRESKFRLSGDEFRADALKYVISLFESKFNV